MPLEPLANSDIPLAVIIDLLSLKNITKSEIHSWMLQNGSKWTVMIITVHFEPLLAVLWDNSFDLTIFLQNFANFFLFFYFFKKPGAQFFSGSQTNPGFQNKNSRRRLTGRLGLSQKIFTGIQKFFLFRDSMKSLEGKTRKV